LLFIVGISVTQQINGETKSKYSLYLVKLYAMCENIGRDICYPMNCKFLYQVELWSVSRHGRFCTNTKVPDYQWIVFAPTPGTSIFSVCQFCNAVSGLTRASSVTPHVVVLHTFLFWTRTFGLSWSQSASCYTAVNSAHSWKPWSQHKSTARQGLLSSCSNVAFVCWWWVVLPAYWSRMFKHKLLMATSDIYTYKWYFDVRTHESILWTSSLLQRLMTV
jgi:hypothetical protein